MLKKLCRKIASRLWRRRVWRFVGVATLLFVTLVLPMIAVMVAGILSASNPIQPTPSSPVAAHAWSALPGWTILLFIIGVVGLFLHAVFEYQRRTHDPTWIFRFQDIFDGDDFIELRKAAVDVLRKNRGNLAATDLELTPIDEVLDFFEDLGFYERGGQISVEVIHHHFYYWIRGYYRAAEPYIKARQAEESATWEHLEPLLALLQRVEAEHDRYKDYLTDKDLDEFFDEEIKTWQAARNKRQPPEEA